MMNIKEAKQEIVNTLHAYLKKDEEGNYTYPLVHQRPLFLIGAPGIGKTAIMEQVAKEENIGLVSYTMTHHTRQSAVGLPKIVSREYEGIFMDVTEYTMSEIIAAVYAKMESTGKKEGILFLDEINCVSETLAPAMLQFLQNKTFGGHKVPAGWLIVAAGNPSGYNKSVREFDIVTLDRVRKMEIQPDLEVWMEYAWQHKIHGAVLSYLNIHRDSFYYIRSSREEKAFVTARGWEDLSRILKSYEDLDIQVTENLICQFIQEKEIGRDFASYYQIYQKYGTDYGIHQILDGSLSKHMEEEKLDMAGNGSAEERLTVTGLFLQDLNERLMCADTGKKRLSLLYDKLNALKEIRKQNGAVMFVGDGINDAPVLAGADVGAAMGSGADAAIEAADVVFMNSSVSAIPQAIKIARATGRISIQNVIFALAVKLLVLVLGFVGFANIWAAVFADTGVAMLCILNSMRILLKKFK